MHQAWQYVVWALVQEFMLQSFFFTRCEELFGSSTAIWVTATFFAVVHVPNMVLDDIHPDWCAILLRNVPAVPEYLSARHRACGAGTDAVRYDSFQSALPSAGRDWVSAISARRPLQPDS